MPHNPDLPHLVDSTLRDGEQAPGLCFGKAQKLSLARELDALGVPEIEIGSPAISEVERDSLQAIIGAGLDAKLLLWCRAHRDDLAWASRCGAQRVHLSLPVSDTILVSMGKSRDWVLERLAVLTRLARDSFGFVSVGAMDASRADASFLATFARAARDEGACRLRLADTLGLLDPLGSKTLVATVRAALSPEPAGMSIEFHAHNDLGLALANSLAAFDAGAAALSVTLCGLGERAGNAALEQLLAAGWRTRQWQWEQAGYRLERLLPLCRLLEDTSGRPLAVDRPVCGRQVLRHESGLHGALWGVDPLAFQPLDYRCLGGREPELCLGKHSGRASTRAWYAQRGLQLDPRVLDKVTQTVKTLSEDLGRGLQDDEAIDIYCQLSTGAIQNVA